MVRIMSKLLTHPMVLAAVGGLILTALGVLAMQLFVA
jgi:hypothetical protein